MAARGAGAAAERVRRIGIFVGATAAGDAEGQARIAAFLQALELLGWTTGRNLQIESRWGVADPANVRKFAAELVALCAGRHSVLRRPFIGTVAAGDAHRADRVRQRRRSGRRRLRQQPGAAGRQRHRLHAVRIQPERKMAGAAQADRAGRDASGGACGMPRSPPAPASSRSSSPWRRRSGWRSARSTCATPARSSAPSLHSPAPRTAASMVTSSALAVRHRELIIGLAARHKLPAVYYRRLFVDRRRPDLLWVRSSRPVPPRGRLCRSHPQGREAGRPAGAGADEVRLGDQPQDRQGARPRPCRRRCSPAPTR